jgi:hypothetical protein
MHRRHILDSVALTCCRWSGVPRICGLAPGAPEVWRFAKSGAGIPHMTENIAIWSGDK